MISFLYVQNTVLSKSHGLQVGMVFHDKNQNSMELKVKKKANEFYIVPE